MDDTGTNTTATTTYTADDGASIAELVLAVGVFFLMIGVGLTCNLQLIRKMIYSPKALKAAAVGVLCQFILMPSVAFLFVWMFNLEGYTALGLALASSMPGGSSSNIFTIWSGGVVELSVFMTVLSTTVAFGMTPLWLYIFAESIDGIDSTNLALDQIALTFGMLVVPLSIGISLNCFSCMQKEAIHHHVERIISALAIVVFLAAIVVLLVEYPDALKVYASWEVYVAAVLFFPIAAGLSYGITTCLKFRPAIQRTVVMEVGLQNLALAFAIGVSQPGITTLEKNQSLPFPLLYAIFMYLWAGLLIPIMRWQKRRNDRNGVVDCDPDFFLSDDVNDAGVTEDAAKDGTYNDVLPEMEVGEEKIDGGQPDESPPA